MTIRKTKSGKWTVDVSNGFHPVTQKRIRIIRKGLKSKKEALELEQHIRVVELKEKQFDFVVTTDMLFDLLEEDDLKNGRKVSMADYGLHGDRSKGETGVWLDVGKPYARKICAMGVKASRWVTMHGFAFNVNTDMKYFGYIIPCGIKGKQVTSLEQELGQKVNIEEVKDKIKKHFSEVFDCQFI